MNWAWHFLITSMRKSDKKNFKKFENFVVSYSRSNIEPLKQNCHPFACVFDDYLWKSYVYRTTFSNVKYIMNHATHCNETEKGRPNK